MKAASIIIFILSIAGFCQAQVPGWQWAKSGNGESKNCKVLVSKSGEVYVTGAFTNTLVLESNTLISKGKMDAYIAKYNANGHLIWAKSLGGLSDDVGIGIAEDHEGKIYFAGYFADSANMEGRKVMSNGLQDVFVVKLSDEGTVLWLNNLGSQYEDQPGPNGAIVADRSGNVIVTGTFGLGGAPPVSANFGGHTLVSTGTDAIFLVKIDPVGNIMWARKAGNTKYSIVTDVQCDGKNNYYITGGFGNNVIYFDSYRFAANGTAGGNMFLAKYDSTGTFQWAKIGNGYLLGTGGGGELIGNALTVDSAGNSCVIGTHENCFVMFDSYRIEGNQYNSNAYIVKYDKEGEVLWANDIGSLGVDLGNSIAQDRQSNVYITGAVSSGAKFHNQTLAGSNLIIYTAKYDRNGDLLWVVKADGSGDEQGSSISLDANGQIYVAGDFASSVLTFGSQTVSKATSKRESFIAKLNGNLTGVFQSIGLPVVSIYPNPAQEFLFLELSSLNYFEEVFICDVLGREVLHEKLSSIGNGLVPVSSIPNGTYYLKLKGPFGISKSQKLIINH